MKPELPQLPLPAWLESISKENTLEFPLREILTDSLYYPASGLNGSPVKYLAGNIYSFVYADYGVTKDEFLNNLNGTSQDSGFKGYHSILQKEITVHEVAPVGWVPPMLPSSEEARESLIRQQSHCVPFGHWSVWQRNPDEPESTGPARFSFFFMAGEMSAIYQGLYSRLSIAPKFLAIIQPGVMGGEWESVTSNDSFFKSVVKSNPAGLPAYLIHGGDGPPNSYDIPCWSEYEGTRLVQLEERCAGVWKLKVT